MTAVPAPPRDAGTVLPAPPQVAPYPPVPAPHATAAPMTVARSPSMALKHVSSGKVREIYDLDDGCLLLVTSDRISAFDVVMAEPIPDKGRVLTAITAFWLDQLSDVAPNHLVEP